MRTNIIKVGNSKGLILSKTILEKYQIKNEVNIRLQDEYIIIEPINKPRIGWDDQFAKAKSADENEQLIPDVFEDEELLSWE
ncbi:MAG: AbrB/MazE/SpoVT family DNA-binding domain-containing protein [Bacteroidia bacterium]|nr:AbrB/MazE/SpoVT family DNA-binding domain-containing protein [Bacteroidia bacterium]NNK89183.1 AbrB/MazE/SpoVT family DNA-binding domain-containing protein [Saprospiraceae bacterium]